MGLIVVLSSFRQAVEMLILVLRLGMSTLIPGPELSELSIDARS